MTDNPTGLGFLPGLLHAWYIISITPDPTYEELVDAERSAGGGTVTYYYVQQGRLQNPSQGGYGTVNSTPNSQFPIAREDGFVRPADQQAQPGSSETAPPTYAQAVRGDNKVQRS